ncbi:MAG: DoxX family protein [Blastochloris sp.]|nr:DoxX family protein [Blastochloris sp.]
MKDLLRLLFLNFLPLNKDLGLLLLRLVFGPYMLVAHGWPKLMGFSDKVNSFPDPLGIGSPASLTLCVAFEVFGAALLTLGLLTRFNALAGVVTMAVAFFLVHEAQFMGQGNGELAFTYLAAYLALLISGGGRYSLDARLGAKL